MAWAGVFLSLLLFYQTAFSAEAVLNNLVVTNTRDDLLLYLDVQGAFTAEMEQAIINGVPASFSFFISLYRKRTFWLNERITEFSVTHTVKYNNLKKEFVVARSWDKGKPAITDSFEEMQRLMSVIEGLKVVQLSQLEKGSEYELKAKAELSKMTLPLYLHHVFFFVSLWDFETDWSAISFGY
ncbi:MAG: DUF4390 domain-containing protein [Thermodesulfobacteriota bacterium]